MPGSAEKILLEEGLNVAVTLTRDAAYCPPGFLLEDPLVRKIISEKSAFREARLLRLPVRESLDELWSKKEQEYSSIRDVYEGLFDARGRRFVQENTRLLVDRPFQVSSLLVSRWEEAPDKIGSWGADYVRQFPPGVVELLRRIPRILAEEGKAITWEMISRRVREVADRHPRYRGLVQNIYFGLYVDLLDLEVITGLPGYLSDFGMSQGRLAYSYQSFHEACQTAGVWATFLQLTDQDIVQLRRTASYFDFRRHYFAICGQCASQVELREALARGAAMRSVELGKEELSSILHPETLPIFGVGEEVLNTFGRRLAIVCEGGLEAIQAQMSRQAKSQQRLRRIKAMVQRDPSVKPRVAIFAPLPEERNRLIRKLGLVSMPGQNFRWAGELDSAHVLLYSTASMGRVPAAVATSRLLADNEQFDALVVAGFAGGFVESKTRQGDVLVPGVVADLAARKIKTTDDRPDRSIRPVPYTVNAELQGYLESHFQQGEWAMRVAADVDWPAGTHPVIKCGKPIVCGDEVVASDLHRAELLAAWPDASGVEMESGGVFAAADALAAKELVKCVVRVVTDMADPSKSDDEWRRRGAETLASLLSAIDWAAVVGA